ncbi:hypothetical protein F4805DRAFT_413427 [Annulohypoxylon moriforme]|nr:hypothetical protein F4805DRAFT_413427 [Annulohypoxylon moriforme]
MKSPNSYTQQATSKMSATLEGLPTELRSLIWSAVGEKENFDSLMMVSQSIRHEILCEIPGALLSCECPYNRPCRCGKGFEIDRLTIIVDCNCSERYWLKFYVYRRQRSIPSVWCIADLDTSLAQVLRYYRPRETVIEFQAPKGIMGGEPDEKYDPYEPYEQYGPYMVFRAKLFDVCEILGWFQPQRERHLKIYFSNPWPPKMGPSPSFWGFQLASINLGLEDPDIQKERESRRDAIDWHLWRKHPAVYESLLLPLILNPSWRNSEVIFDRNPRGASSFYYIRKSHGRLVEHEKFDYKLLSVTAWAHIDQLITDGSVKLDDDDLTPYYKQYDNNVEVWAAEKAQRPMLQAAFHSSLLEMIDFGFSFDLMLEQLTRHPLSDRLFKPLRSHIRRTYNLSPSNSFSKDHQDYEDDRWPWNLEPIRRAFINWAQEDPERRVNGKRRYICYPHVEWLFGHPAVLSFLEWRQDYKPLWPKSWARNWPPLKKKELVHAALARKMLGLEGIEDL